VRLVSAWVEVEVAVLVATAIVAVPLEAKKPDIELWRGVIEVLFEDMKPSVLAIAVADEEGSVVRVWAGEDSEDWVVLVWARVVLVVLTFATDTIVLVFWAGVVLEVLTFATDIIVLVLWAGAVFMVLTFPTSVIVLVLWADAMFVVLFFATDSIVVMIWAGVELVVVSTGSVGSVGIGAVIIVGAAAVLVGAGAGAVIVFGAAAVVVGAAAFVVDAAATLVGGAAVVVGGGGAAEEVCAAVVVVDAAAIVVAGAGIGLWFVIDAITTPSGREKKVSWVSQHPGLGGLSASGRLPSQQYSPLLHWRIAWLPPPESLSIKPLELLSSHATWIGLLVMHCEKHPEPQLLSVHVYLPMYGGERAGFWHNPLLKHSHW
jgi:hypothetical protein